MRQKLRKVVAHGLLQEYEVSKAGSKPKNYRDDLAERPVVAQNWDEMAEQMMRQNCLYET